MLPGMSAVVDVSATLMSVTPEVSSHHPRKGPPPLPPSHRKCGCQQNSINIRDPARLGGGGEQSRLVFMGVASHALSYAPILLPENIYAIFTTA